MPPPPAEPLASRFVLGPALRTQPDRRLVKLVREGYEAAFEEIVRRYRRPLDRFAAAIVGNRSEDVTQDAFSKALLALRGTDAEIELRPWLYRIVRNTALNDLRDAPPVTEELGETVAGGASAAVEAERREEVAELMERLRALPEPQRAAIVMRELEGLSHEEIAAALGVSGGGARQAIYRARMALRDGLGLLVPLPLLRMLFDHGAEAAAAAGAGGAAAAGVATASGGGGAALGGLGAGGALKAGAATVLVAGSVGAGVAIQQNRDGRAPEPAAASAVQTPGGEMAGSNGSDSSSGSSGPGSSGESGDGRGSGDSGDDRDGPNRGSSDDADDDSSGRGRGRGRGGDDDSSGRGRGRGGDDSSGSSGRSGGDDVDDDSDERRRIGSSGPGSGEEGDDDDSGSGSSNSGPGSGSSGPGSGSTTASIPPPEASDDDGDDSISGGSGSGSDDSESGGSGEDD
jgi:RNA polymerase sigma factor (sigma-70 family)